MNGPGWRVDPASAFAATRGARDEAEHVEAAARALRAAIDEACAVLAGTQSRDALDGLREDPFGIELDETAERLRASADAVDRSVQAYEYGDREMSRQVAAAQGSVPLAARRPEAL